MQTLTFDQWLGTSTVIKKDNGFFHVDGSRVVLHKKNYDILQTQIFEVTESFELIELCTFQACLEMNEKLTLEDLKNFFYN
jgi:hypothetical protein